MRSIRILAAPAAGMAFMMAAASGALAASDPTGVWINDTGRGAVEIKNCGSALCGHIVWVKDTSDTKGCGKQIIGDATSVGAGRWDNGWIYSPEKRKNYDVELKPLSDGTLQVMGYAGTKLFSRTMIWTRAPADLKRCGETVATVTPAPATPPAAASATPSVAAKTEAAKELPHPAAAPATAPSTSTTVEAKTDTAKPDAGNTTAAAKDQQPATSKSETGPTKTGETDDDEDGNGGEKPGERTHKRGLKLGDLDLDKVLTRTKSGKCKLDLPFVKVQFSCDRN